MDSYFASPCRSDETELRHQLEMAASNPVIDGIMQIVGGLIAVLNDNRQILTVNRQLLNSLAVDNPDDVFGLRPGEAIGCRYAVEMAAGCGTSEYCLHCGAVIAIVASLKSNVPVERNCTICAERNGQTLDLYFRVHAAPISIDGQKFILLFLNDISQQQRLYALERVFFHDIDNTAMGLLSAAEQLGHTSSRVAAGLADNISSLTMRLTREMELQRSLSQYQSASLDIRLEVISVEWIVEELEKMLESHPAVREKKFQVQNSAPGLLLHTDPALILRVLSHMLVNAFEAAENCRTVQLKLAARYGHAVFSVWNAEVISPSIAGRIFQRNFSTKEELGRGLGTFTMKLIGEKLLGGRVFFESTTDKGTTFNLELPV